MQINSKLNSKPYDYLYKVSLLTDWGDHGRVKTYVFPSRAVLRRNFDILCPCAYSMAQCYKRKGKLSFDSDISSPEGKKICESPHSDPNINTASDEGEDDQLLEALNMTKRIATQLELN